jgi:hypothetical protein
MVMSGGLCVVSRVVSTQSPAPTEAAREAAGEKHPEPESTHTHQMKNNCHNQRMKQNCNCKNRRHGTSPDTQVRESRFTGDNQ